MKMKINSAVFIMAGPAGRSVHTCRGMIKRVLEYLQGRSLRPAEKSGTAASDKQ
jgi:hypothetical protein